MLPAKFKVLNTIVKETIFFNSLCIFHVETNLDYNKDFKLKYIIKVLILINLFFAGLPTELKKRPGLGIRIQIRFIKNSVISHFKKNRCRHT
jgi:hypothetical protein